VWARPFVRDTSGARWDHPHGEWGRSALHRAPCEGLPEPEAYFPAIRTGMYSMQGLRLKLAERAWYKTMIAPLFPQY
jgi:hypothetical protein